MMHNFLRKDEKHGEISTYYRLKHHCGKKVGHFSLQCFQTKTTRQSTLIRVKSGNFGHQVNSDSDLNCYIL